MQKQYPLIIIVIFLSYFALVQAQDESILQLALTPVAHNADWTPYERDFDGVTMVLVPSGSFMMGSDTGASNELPVHEQIISQPFWIDKYEVTQAEFSRLGGKQKESSFFVGENHPVETITWVEAQDFCQMRGGRLPTEAEWEYAARGVDNLLYPWGNEWQDDKSAWENTSMGGTVDVGSFPDGVSWIGAQDMSGNVWEWVSSLYMPYPYSSNSEGDATRTNIRVLRGGAWYLPEIYLLSDRRFKLDYKSSKYYFGFRCARDFMPTKLSQSASIPIAHNADWMPYEQEFDGVTMVLVPVGSFMMGSTDAQIEYGAGASDEGPEAIEDEQPAHEQIFTEPFWIDKYEVSQADYLSLAEMPAREFYHLGENLPVELLNWFAARDFCLLRNARLPTESEWEYAARGPDNLIFPWGDEWNDENVISGRDWTSTAEVGSVPAGASWVGAQDMSGNVWEWVSSLYSDYPYDSQHESKSDTKKNRVLRGGAWLETVISLFRTSDRVTASPEYWNYETGFRCARNFSESDLQGD